MVRVLPHEEPEGFSEFVYTAAKKNTRVGVVRHAYRLAHVSRTRGDELRDQTGWRHAGEKLANGSVRNT